MAAFPELKQRRLTKRRETPRDPLGEPEEEFDIDEAMKIDLDDDDDIWA